MSNKEIHFSFCTSTNTVWFVLKQSRWLRLFYRHFGLVTTSVNLFFFIWPEFLFLQDTKVIQDSWTGTKRKLWDQNRPTEDGDGSWWDHKSINNQLINQWWKADLLCRKQINRFNWFILTEKQSMQKAIDEFNTKTTRVITTLSIRLLMAIKREKKRERTRVPSVVKCPASGLCVNSPCVTANDNKPSNLRFYSVISHLRPSIQNQHRPIDMTSHRLPRRVGQMWRLRKRKHSLSFFFFFFLITKLY